MLAEPQVGLTLVFIVSLVSARLLLLRSEPAVSAMVKANAALFWPLILVVIASNTLGGAIDCYTGFRARNPVALCWLERFGAKTLLLSWLPGIISHPICALAGRLAAASVLAFCFYIAIGKFLRHMAMSWLLLSYLVP